MVPGGRWLSQGCGGAHGGRHDKNSWRLSPREPVVNACGSAGHVPVFSLLPARTLLSGGACGECRMLGQPSLITVVCPCPHRMPLERDRVSLQDLGPLSYRRCQLGHPGAEPGPGHRDCPAFPRLVGSRPVCCPPAPSPSHLHSHLSREPLVSDDAAPGMGTGPACRGSASFQPRERP